MEKRAVNAVRPGRLAQLVEHLVYTERVGGSSPSPPTTVSDRRSGGSIRLLAILLLIVSWLGGSATPSLAEDAMAFQLASVGNGHSCRQGCIQVITAEGEINNDTAQKFLSFLSEHLQDHDLRPFVLIDSPGGTVLGAMQLGTVFRTIGAAVMVAGTRDTPESANLRFTAANCMSACVYAFMGGKKRLVPSVSRLGIHRMVIHEAVRDPSGGMDSENIYGSDEFVASLSAYTKSMGVDPRVIAYAEHIPAEAIHILTPAEIRRWHIGSAKL